MTYYILCNFPSFNPLLGFNVAIHSFQTLVWAYCWRDQKLRGRINFRVIGSVFSNLLWLLFSILFLSYSPTHFSLKENYRRDRENENGLVIKKAAVCIWTHIVYTCSNNFVLFTMLGCFYGKRVLLECMVNDT